MALTSVGLFCCLQVLFLTTTKFNRRSGLYFWSIIGVTVSQICYCIYVYLYIWILKDAKPGLTAGFMVAGGLPYVPFEFLMLYSRLHLFLASKKVLRLVLALIVVEWWLIEVPLAVGEILTIVYPESAQMAILYDLTAKIEAVVYTVCDTFLCTLYFFQVKNIWGDIPMKKRMLRHVGFMNVVVILLDSLFMVLLWTVNDELSSGISAMDFSIKLLVEIYTLNTIIEACRQQREAANQRNSARSMASIHMKVDSNMEFKELDKKS
ncbi:hypothetical protein BT63DRAFT_476885 [Microthyrium microscopicum]|uniref:DUF7703 domain-containing protein n=1 Tax=Microthyrium microscopicum TaxID=703497 RepID=A0A6A6UK32_9PEZI|nr:hypothetical protein BT63DRAFT_476885 [Microthyrium microscopicum]